MDAETEEDPAAGAEALITPHKIQIQTSSDRTVEAAEAVEETNDPTMEEGAAT